MSTRRWFINVSAVLLLAGLLIFQPGRGAPPAAKAASDPAATLKIMPLGDSITSGTDVTYTPTLASYRCELYKKLDAASYDFNFVGSVHGQWGNDDRNLTPPFCVTGYDIDEEGHSGWSTNDILNGAPSSWPGKLSDWAATYTPDLVLIHLGTVDLLDTSATANDTATRIGQIIDTLRAANPHVKIILAQIIPGSTGGVNGTESPKIPQFNALLPGLVASKTTADSPIELVDMHTNFSIKDHTVDGIHPNANGENKMAGRWKTAIDLMIRLTNHTYIPVVVR